MATLAEEADCEAQLWLETCAPSLSRELYVPEARTPTDLRSLHVIVRVPRGARGLGAAVAGRQATTPRTSMRSGYENSSKYMSRILGALTYPSGCVSHHFLSVSEFDIQVSVRFLHCYTSQSRIGEVSLLHLVSVEAGVL